MMPLSVNGKKSYCNIKFYSINSIVRNDLKLQPKGKNLLQEFTTGTYSKNLLQEFTPEIYSKNLLQEFSSVMTYPGALGKTKSKT